MTRRASQIPGRYAREIDSQPAGGGASTEEPALTASQEGGDPAHPAQGYFVDYSPAAAEDLEYGHIFCGPHDVPGAQCPNCDKPLLRFLALDTADPRLGLEESPFPVLSLLFCWRCPLAQQPFQYRIAEDGSVTLLRCGRGAPEGDFPYEEYPDHFPQVPARLTAMTAEAQWLIERLNAGELGRDDLPKPPRSLDEPRHQVGGEPYLIQKNTKYRMPCPVCREAMPFLAAIADNCLDARGFTDNCGVQVLFHYCRKCHVVGAFHQCD